MSSVKPLVLTAKAFVKMIKWMAEYANFKSIMTPNWVESMGIIFCRETIDKYIVADAEGITYGNLVYVETSPQQVAEIVRIEEKLKQEDHTIFAGGWFHSHPGHGLFFSGTDIGNQAYWQNNNPNGCGLVFDLTLVSDNFLGFKFFRLDTTQNYYDVPYELYGFSEDTLVEAFEPVGIETKTIHRLAINLGLKAKDGVVEFDKIEIPKTDDPVGTAKKVMIKAKKAYMTGQISKTIEQYRIANILLKNTKETELYIKATRKLAKMCVLFDYPDTANSLLKDLLDLSQRMKEKSGILEGVARILLGNLSDIQKQPEASVNHYQLAIDAFKKESYNDGCYQAAELAGGASWKLNHKNDTIQYFKQAIEHADKAQKDGSRKSPMIWTVIKKGLNDKIRSAEGSISNSGIEKIA